MNIIQLKKECLYIIKIAIRLSLLELQCPLITEVWCIVCMYCIMYIHIFI